VLTLTRLISHQTGPRSLPADWISHPATKSATSCGRTIAAQGKDKSFIRGKGDVGRKGEQIHQGLSYPISPTYSPFLLKDF
jgi:hypothetical protein